MTLRERLRVLDRVQRTRAFMVAASILVSVVAVVALGVWFVAETAPAPEAPVAVGEALTPEQLAERQQQFDRFMSTLGVDTGRAGVVVGVVGGAIVALAAIWFGLALTYLALLVLGAALVVPLALYEPTGGLARLLAGILLLTMTFTALLQGLRLVLSLPGPVFAVARNVLSEAVRLKLSLVFIVLLVFALAALPLLLDPQSPLRYRVQALLQYATGTSFWVIAVLVLFFSVATVTFEQRDKVIWQTMTKPVAAWQYLLGKWLGVVSLAAVLLAVCASGVFMFTDYLKNQPASGERSAFVPEAEGVAVVEDRLILQTQVLSARRVVPPVSPIDIFEIDLDAAVRQRVEAERRQDERFEPTARQLAEFRKEAIDAVSASYLTVDPEEEQSEIYVFAGLGPAKERAAPITLRYKIEAEGNRPDVIYELSFLFLNTGHVVTRRTGLGFSHTMPVDPIAIDDEGRLHVQIFNGAVFDTGSGALAIAPNPQAIVFPRDGLEVSYSAGSYHANFLRVVLVLWVKLAFLAAIGVCASTFLSFPVASLLAMGTFFVAEGAAFISGSLQQFNTENIEGEFRTYRWVVRHVAEWVSNLFLVYADLRPTTRLSTGVMLSWNEVAFGSIVLAAATLALYAVAVLVFRRRELAMYSGH